ncbi:MAG: FtsX-like permease family protein [Haloferacaceae archaeon]
MTDGGRGRRRHRVVAVLGLAARRVSGRLTAGGSRRLLLSVLGVAAAVMLMTTVTGVALGMAAQGVVRGDDVDYWVVPESSSLDTVAVATSGPRLGDTHALADRLAADDRVTYATPVLLQVVSLRNRASDTSEYVLLVGVIPPDGGDRTVAGLPTAPLTPGDPHYAGGSYDGPWTGELVANGAAATVLNASTGDVLVPRGGGDVTGGANGTAAGGVPPGSFRVTTVAEGEFTTGVGTAPVALVHLSELQAVTGATGGDAADQLLVSTNDPGVRDRLAGIYPRTTVVARSGIAARDVSTTSLPLAMGVAALVVALVVGVLFTATMMGLEVTDDRTTLAVLAAVGYSGRSRTLLVVAETVSLALVGGALGVALGAVGVAVTNAAATHAFGVGDVAVFRPVLVAYGLGVAGAIGLLSAPYPAWLSRRAAPTAVMRG